MSIEKRVIILISTALIILSISCNMMDKAIKKEARVNFKNEILFTGRFKNDSISELLIFRKHNYFEYSISTRPYSKKSLHGYAGVYNKRHDTIFFHFYKEYKPFDKAGFVILDSINNVINYPSANDLKPHYLDLRK